ncbi:DUF3562 domain-containing protein [Burkholderia cenocepacia]|jgi:hypothetical protein|uniref:DUF3562 domain-containing protein n=1 Tax=Burkholderia cenocepacia TaxID=95486 RepID=UPI001B9D560D|nr:DUF3562 domain-containing protein [Burkholderia cenocepacia]MBR8407068.1 DUF3562 domain-containing protein [Burkholderia cenocepacia]MCW3658708.1 DUF3562 domain-containing protein [Burkholderia cenocepacia]MDN7619158.1 DUF3562 domain-containing protein [Burkholderia cenocepacia]MDR8102025.1 DUF3562 domain-containing protein [Burkholderia cenocepacia]MDS0804508.1 DUF3562 domain-containing protein [Burkholderia cenocepacia]
MPKDNLLDSLKEAAEQRAIGADQLRAMLDDEVRALSSGARVHDYIHVFAIRNLRERMRQKDEFDRDTRADAAPADAGPRPSHRL